MSLSKKPLSKVNKNMEEKRSKESSNKMTKEEVEEREHFKKIIRAFKSYKEDSKIRLNTTRGYLKQIPFAHQELLEKFGYQKGLDEVEKCIEVNNDILMEIIKDVANMFENVHQDEKQMQIDNDRLNKTAPMDREKVQSTIKQLVRDWSRDGAEEREGCYRPILEELNKRFNDRGDSSEERKVLVPGAGLGRLAFEIAKMGFECQGNEFSLYMLFAANFVLNKCSDVDCFKIHPWIHQFTNNHSVENIIQPSFFPDIDPNELPEGSKFSMVAGDFLDVYSEPEYAKSQDCVVTCFFLDCAHNVMDFIQLIHKVLKPGGYWINLGPLLYHFADIPQEASIEPSYDIVKKLIQDQGFKFLMEETEKPTTYCQNPKSMMQFYYKSVFFTCQK